MSNLYDVEANFSKMVDEVSSQIDTSFTAEEMAALNAFAKSPAMTPVADTATGDTAGMFDDGFAAVGNVIPAVPVSNGDSLSTATKCGIGAIAVTAIATIGYFVYEHFFAGE